MRVVAVALEPDAGWGPGHPIVVFVDHVDAPGPWWSVPWLWADDSVMPYHVHGEPA